MNHPLVDEFKDGTCEWCCDDGQVYVDNGRCEQCDSDIRHCAICDQDYHRDDTCRHIFEDQYFEWAGSGIGTPEDRIESAFRGLLRAMPDGFAEGLRIGIACGGFHTWLVAPMIGGGGCLSLYGIPYPQSRVWGDALIKLGERDDIEDIADGYHWLVSLYDDITPAANQITIAWLDAWIAERTGDLEAFDRLADDGCIIVPRTEHYIQQGNEDQP